MAFLSTVVLAATAGGSVTPDPFQDGPNFNDVDVHASKSESLRDPPAQRGTGLIIAGAISTGVVLTARTAFSGLVLESVICAHHRDVNGACLEDWSDMFAIIGDSITPGFAPALGLLGAGLARRGRWHAQTDLVLRTDMKRRKRIGWALLGSGLGLWVGSIAIAHVCNDRGRTKCFLGVHEAGFYIGGALTGAGIGLAPFAAAYDREARKRARGEALRVSPSIGWGTAGLSLSGRF